jgi:mannosyltransferase OCH1-like enzyme
METNSITIICIFILVATIICYYIFIVLYKAPEVCIPTIINSKQIIKQKYKPSSSPKPPIIPKKIFQTWHSKDLPPKMQENIVNIQKQNPELEYFLFDDNDCADFIKTHFGTEVVDAYNKLIPGAYKADLWRYCVIYIYGGVYLDIKYKCLDGFKFIDIMDREHFVLERPGFWKPGTHGIYNALIIAKPGNPVFLDCIKQIVSNTQTDCYGFNRLYPTGPGLLGELYFGNINDNIKMFDNFEMVYNTFHGQDVVIYKNQIILQSYPEYRIEQRDKQKQRHYNELWNERAIYTSPYIN